MGTYKITGPNGSVGVEESDPSEWSDRFEGAIFDALWLDNQEIGVGQQVVIERVL